MSWKDKYDRVNSAFGGAVFIFGDFYNLEECKKIMKEEYWDDMEDINQFVDVDHTYIHFGVFTSEEGEKCSGWHTLQGKPKSMKGCIKATEVLKVKLKRDDELCLKQ